MIRTPSLRQWLGIEIVEVSRWEKLVATLGGGLAIGLLLLISTRVLPAGSALPVLASMGASAVLLFAMPHGPLSQPWPLVLGHVLSAIIGVLCARWIPHPMLAAACAVGLAIGAMVQFKCIHPPGGATALTAVIGGPAVRELGFHYVLVPVLANVLVLVLLAVLLNLAFPWRRYPSALHRLPPPQPPQPAPATHDEVLAALRSLDSFVDVSEEDLLRLVEWLDRHHRPGGPSR